MAIVTRGISKLREKIAANRELTAQIEPQIRQFEAKSGSILTIPADYLAMLEYDDELAPDALYEVVKAIENSPNIDLLYTDGAQDYDRALRASAQAQAMHHVPNFLGHWRYVAGSASEKVHAKPEALESGRQALEDYVRNSGMDAWVEDAGR